MGAHLSTVHAQVTEQFKKQDNGNKGYLVSLVHCAYVYGSAEQLVIGSSVFACKLHEQAPDDASGLLCVLQTLKEVMGIRPLYNLNPSHVGVLYQVDK
jgi:hypothetical protein